MSPRISVPLQRPGILNKSAVEFLMKDFCLNSIFRVASIIRTLYWYFFRPITIGVKVIVTSQDKILLVKNRYDTYWYLPGGGVKSKETVTECAQREIWEECGIKAENLKILSVYTNFKEYKSDHILLLRADVSGQSLTQGLEIEKAGFFAGDLLPEEISPATEKRLKEFWAGEYTCGEW